MRVGAVLGLLMVPGLVLAQPPCSPLPPPTGTTIEVYPAQASSLRATVAGAASGTTVLLHDGTYDLSCGDSGCRLVFNTPGVTLRSFSGNRDAVVLDGWDGFSIDYNTHELVSIYASNVTIADLTLTRAEHHPIHISGPGAPISGILIHNVKIVDPGQQAIKVNDDETGIGVVDHGIIQCSHLELTDQGRGFVDGCYTGGIDVHAATGWVVRRNYIEGFWCDAGLSEHGIHFWRECADTLVEENVIVDCARGIGFGLGYGTDFGHVGGVIRNNFVAATRDELFLPPHLNEYGFDTGIGLESAAGAGVYNNTVFSDDAPRSSSIEWRWDITTAEIANNLTSHSQISRDGGVATLNTGNRTGAPASWFVDPANGDLHLTSGSLLPVDGGTALDPGDCDNDHDGQLRGASPDQGADEYGDTFQPLFVDGFELGHTLMWSSTLG